MIRISGCCLMPTQQYHIVKTINFQ